jgi:hypothetical protein
MIARVTSALLVAGTVALSGCMNDVHARRDGLTAGAGDAIAANTVLQMVDPWPAGVQNTNLRVPAQRPEIAGDRPNSQSTTGYED